MKFAFNLMTRHAPVLLVALAISAPICASPQAPTKDLSMSPAEQEHAIALLRRAYAAFNRDDIPAAVESLDPHIEWTEPPEFPGGGTYHGPAEVAAYLTNSRANWAEGASTPEQLIPHGNRIVVLVHARFRLKDSTAWTEVKLADVYTFRNGRPVQMRAFADQAEAQRWAAIKS